MVVMGFWQEAAQEAPADTTSVLIPPVSDLAGRFLDPDNWVAVLGSGLRIIVIIVLAWVIVRLIDKATKRGTRRFESLSETHPRRQRAFTISTLLTSTTRYVVWPLAIIMVLSEFKLDISALIATAGIAGIALGFGAQTLVQDFISGVFLLFDDTIHVGDIISVGGQEGTVEYIGIRLIKVRKLNGELLMVPAGEVRIFGNKSIDFMRVVVTVGLAYEQNLDDILPVLQRIADEWAADHQSILKEEKPLVQAITELADSSVNVRILVMVQPGEQFEAERDLRRRIKRKFDELGIEIPFPRRTIYMKHEESSPQK